MSKNTTVITAFGVDIFISGGASTQTVYNGSGTPWTLETTTPFELGWAVPGGEPYSPKPPEPIPYLNGSPPFSLARITRAIGYDVVTESFGVQMRATSKDNAVALLRLLRNAISAAVGNYSGTVPYLGIKGGTSYAYYHLLAGTVTETADHVKEAASDSSNPYVIRAVVTWTRSGLGARISGETLINGTSWANAGTGTPDNMESLGTGAGDMVYEGGPLNITVRTSNSGGGDPVRRVIMASVYQRTYVGLSASNTWSTSGTTYATGGTIAVWANNLDLTNLRGNYRIRMRLLAVNSAYTGAPEFRFQLFNGAGSGVSPIYSTPVPPINGDGHNTGRFVDSGPIPITIQDLRNLNDMNWSVQFQIRSSDGAATTGTLVSVEAILYMDWCDVRLTGASWGTGGGTNYDLNTTAFAQTTNRPCLPLPYPQAMLTDPSTSNRAIEMGEVRGTVPRFYQDAQLYVRLLDASGASSGNMYTTTTRTFTTTVSHSPLYRTLRGGG